MDDLPETLGGCADLLYATRQKRLAMQKELDAVADLERELREHIINTMPKSDTGAAGRVARVSVVTKEVPTVGNWEKFYEHIYQTRSFDLLQRRVSDAAVKERWENNEQIPGVEVFNSVNVSLNKL